MTKTRHPQNQLYYGDNLDVLRRIEDESVDLVYLDPPFNSSQDYNVYFKEAGGKHSSAQVSAFEDTWHWDVRSAENFQEVVESGGKPAELLLALRAFLGQSDMLAYIAVMGPRLIELRRVLKNTGSIYLHCDSTASHYLKLLMDAVFGPSSFRTEIVWQRTGAHSDVRQGRRQYGRVHDIVLFYTKTDEWTWNPTYTPYDPEYVATKYRYTEPETGRRFRLDNLTGPGGAAKGNPAYEVMGVTRHWRYSREKMEELIAEGRIVQTRPGTVPQYKRYLDEMPGVPIGDVWTDIAPINSQAAERLGYPTQKPEALLERIIRISSNPGDTVLDPFCGCGTTIIAAQRLHRRWIGIDITSIAINLIKTRLQATFGDDVRYEVRGEPVNIAEATELARTEHHQFEWWALGLVGARPAEPKKGAVRGIDGRLYFHDEGTGGKTKQIVLQVNSGHVHASHVRDFVGVVRREGADIGALISFHEPTKAMRAEAASAGYYSSAWGRHPKIQLLTIEELLAGKGLDYPRTAGTNVTFRPAPRARAIVAEQDDLFSTQLDLADRIAQLLRAEAGLGVSEAAERLLEALAKDSRIALTVPKMVRGESFKSWVSKLARVVEPSLLLHHATVLRNKAIHEPELDWPLQDFKR